MCWSHLQSLFIKGSQFILYSVSGPCLWRGVCSSSEDRQVVLKLIWGWVLGTGENLYAHKITFLLFFFSYILYQNLKSCLLGWRFSVTLVAFLLPLILSTRAWASLIRSVMLLSWWRFFSTLSDTLQATTTEYGHMHIYTQRITVCQGYCTIQFFIIYPAESRNPPKGTEDSYNSLRLCISIKCHSHVLSVIYL